uniref:C-type lectin n=1 Tax=Acrobeloides nanus TaxID=290746 RepID=A0A914EF11_9BILA
MWSKLVAIVSLVVVSSWALPMLNRPANHALSARPECSMNASAAWVDVVLLIDTSSNMGSANLRKISTVISLVMSKFTIGNRANISAGEHNTRVAVITYDREARIVANFTDINSLGDLSTVLNKIQVSNTADANLYDPAINRYISDVAPLNDGVTSAVITINFNPSDEQLTTTLNSLSNYPFLPNVTMYNFLGNSNSLATDLSWALTQANCYCKFDDGIPLVLIDKSKNRYSRYAKCMNGGGENDPEGGMPDNYTKFCTSDGLIPLAILSQDEENFVYNVFYYSSILYNYIGLHQDSKGNWVWYDENMKEFSSSYFNWVPGYPKNLGKCVVVDFSSDRSQGWKDADCDPQYSGYVSGLCQRGACDAESVACGLVNLPNINLTLVEKKKRMAAYKLPQMKQFHKKNLKVVRKF